jgi:simple sugar transport system ATP-binding protein
VSNCMKAAHLGKTFPGVVALQNVSLEVPKAKVVALVGANGAGKSTLIKILTGYYEDYDGQIEIDGQPAAIHSPKDARQFGIEAVYQEVDTALIPSLTVTENVLIEQLAQESGRIFLNWKALHQAAENILGSVGLDIDVRKRVEDLVLHEKQMLLIARAVSQKVRYLIFDEPTTSLGLREVERLFAVIRELKQKQVGIIYISHRLGEVRDIADSVVVLRNGQKVGDFSAAEADTGKVTEAMLGAPMTEIFPLKNEISRGAAVLDVRSLSRRGVLHGINFQAYQGEILGIAGLVGAGKTELLKALFGSETIDSGEIWVDGERRRLHSPTDAVRSGIFLIPEERRSQGVLVEESVQRNLSLPFLSQFSWASGLMRPARELNHAQTIIQQLGLIPAEPDKAVRDLSGGNQQKVAIGKWFASVPRVMMFDEATQGIDVRAKRDVYALARSLAQTSAVLYASSDIDEVVGIADRVLVMRDGRIVAELNGQDIDRTQILEYATGTRAPLIHQTPEIEIGVKSP